MKIYNEIATIKSNHKIAYNIFESHMYSPNISSVVKPGQFINILPSKDWNKIMRRPMSVASQKENIELTSNGILYTLGVLEDILTHCFNIYSLLLYKYSKIKSRKMKA